MEAFRRMIIYLYAWYMVQDRSFADGRFDMFSAIACVAL